MSLGTISNAAGSPGNKDLVEAYSPILLATITFTSGAILLLSTRPLNTTEGGYAFPGTAGVAAGSYIGRLLQQNIDAIQAMSETGIDIPPTITLQIADADKFLWTNYEATLGFKGAQINLDLVLWQAGTGNFSSDSYRKFTGICNSPNIDEDTLTLSASSKLNMQKILLPLIAVQTRCPWIFPASATDRGNACNNASSPLYPCGYSADQSGGVGNNLANGGIAANQADATGVAGTLTDAAGNFLQCDYTAAGCALRGMYTKDSRSNQTGRFGGVQWDPPLWWKSKSYLLDKTISGVNATVSQRYSDYIPLVYGQVFVDGVVLNVIVDANSTRMEVLICFGNIGNGSWSGSASSTGGVQMVVCNGVTVPYNYNSVGGPDPVDALFRWQYVNYGNRNGMANTDDDYSNNPGVAYSGLGDPYGNLAVIEIVVPIALMTSQTVPTVQILTIGPTVRVWGIGSLTDSTVPGFTYENVVGAAPPPGQGNPIWVLMDVLIRSNWAYSQLDIQSFITAAALCEVQIAYTNNAGVLGNTNVDGSPHMRYACSLQVAKRRTASDVIQGIRNCCKAMLVPNGSTGLLQVFIKQTMADQQPAAITGSNNGTGISSITAAGASATGYSAYDFDESSILLNASGVSTLKITQRTVVDSPNSITTNFQDQDNQFVVDSMTELDPVDVTRAAQTVTGGINIDGLNSFDQGQRVFETRFAETFRGNQRGDSGGTLLFNFETTQKVAHLQVGQIGRFSHQQLGLSFQTVRVISIQASTDFESAKLQLQWHEDRWYTDTYGQIGSPIYSGNNKQQLTRPPFAWQPDQEKPLASDQMVPPLTYTFGMAVVYSVAADGTAIVTIAVNGACPVNIFATLQAPLLALQGTSAGGGTIPPGQTIYAVVCPYAIGTPSKFAPPQVQPCVITTPPGGSGYSATVPVPVWPGNPSPHGYDIFAGLSPMTMTFQGTATGTPSSITFTALNPPSLGPPDVMLDHITLRVKMQIHGGVWGAAVDVITATTLQFLGATWGTNQWANYDLTVTGEIGSDGSLPVWNLRIASNTADTLTVASSTPSLLALDTTRPTGYQGVNVGDACVMRALPSVFTSLTLGDGNFINNTTPLNTGSTVGLTVNEGAYVLRIFAGTGKGQWRNVVSNTATVYTVDQPFNPVPDATSRFWIEAQQWQPAVDSSQIQNSTMTRGFMATVPANNLAGDSIIVQALTMDVNENSCLEQYAPIRDFYIFGVPGSAGGFFVLVPTANAVTPNLVNGANQKLILNQSAQITINTPINSAGVILAGRSLALYVIQDATGQRPTPAFGTGFGSDVKSKVLAGDVNTRSAITMKLHDDGLWHLDGFLTGEPLT
jgi:hypothetical protein